MNPEIVVALIAGGFAIVVALIERSRRDNNRDHGRNATTLDRIERKIDRHLNDHARGGMK